MALACYALVLWWPFRLAVPQRLDNGARWTAEGSLRADTPGLALSPAAPAWQARARDTGELRISLRARALAARQRGPARLFTLSRDTYVQNLVIGQSGSDLVVRIRSACSRQAAGCRRQMRLADVFASPQWQEIELEISPGSARLGVAGRAETRITLPDDALRVWEGSHRLALANDVTGLRPWRGELGRAVVAVDGVNFDGLDASTVELPPSFWLTEREPKLIPFRNARPADIVVNLFLFVPFGLALAGLRGRSRWRPLLHVVAIAGISTFFELGQLIVVDRNPSVTDVILNVLGGSMAMAGLTASRARSHQGRSGGSVIQGDGEP